MNAASRPRHTIQLLDYPIHIGPWLLDAVGSVAAESAPAHAYAIITDTQVGPLAVPQVAGSLRHFAPNSRVLLRAVSPGESHKTRETWSQLTDWLLDERCGRDTTIVAVGGGVVGDLAGFVAATFMRGVPVVQVPTSLLAMVDASVGGKVGVDTPHGKNLVGAFHQPAAVIIDPTVLQTLPLEHLRAGFAEVVKHGVIADASYVARAVAVGAALLAQPPADAAWHGDDLTDLVTDSVRIKAAIVEGDERERGRRQVLNFGHTVAHAIEACTGFAMLHGDAVAIGLSVEAGLAERIGVAEPGMRAAIDRALETLGLPTRLPAGVAPQALVERMRADKKSRRGSLVFALPQRVGSMVQAGRGIEVEALDVQSFLQER